MIWKTEVEVTLASLQVEWRLRSACSERKNYHTLPFSDLSRPSFERHVR